MQYIKPIFLTLFAVLLSAGCAAPKPVEPYAIGGSRSDASVEVAYNFSLGSQPPSAYKLLSVARQKCRAWGYDNAEAFGGHNKTCQDQYCWNGQVVVQYQCLGSPE